MTKWSTRTVCLLGYNYSLTCTPYQYSWHRIDFQADVANNVPAAVGEVFYVRLFTAQVFHNTTGDETDGYWPALTLPAGVSLAISAQTPVVCRYSPKPPDGQQSVWQSVDRSHRLSAVPGSWGERRGRVRLQDHRTRRWVRGLRPGRLQRAAGRSRQR